MTQEQRDEVKQMTYAILYGQSATATGASMGISTAQADQLQSSFMATYPGIRTFIQTAKRLCQQVRDGGPQAHIYGARVGAGGSDIQPEG